MQRIGKRYPAYFFGSLLLIVMVLVSLGLSTTHALAKSSGGRKTHTEKVAVMRKNDKALKAATLNAKGLSIAWRDVLQHKVKLLKHLKKAIAQEKGSVYSTRQVKTLTHKIDKLNAKYQHKLKKLRAHKDPADIHYSWYKEKSGYTAFMKEKVKWRGRRMIIVWGIHENDGKFTNYGGHGAGFILG